MNCFVIMPYGRTEQDKREYARIYKLLIKSAAEDLGLNCIRSDIEDRGGHILSHVIENLAEDDVVIADLSGLNWNVAYELGIRHVLRKNGTILICNDATELPFDIQSLNIFIYPQNWLDEMETLCEKLKKAIDNRINGVTKSDSPVHERYAFLPDDLIKMQSEGTDDALIKAKERIASLEHELASVYEKVESMGLSINASQSNTAIDYSKQFITELANSIYNSDAAVSKLRELKDSGDKEAFLEFLGKVLNVGFLDETDCRIIYGLCRDMQVPAVTRIYLEAVTKFYPENDDLSGYLADEYSKNYHTGDKALQMVNGIVGVSKKDGSFVLSKTVRITREKLISFFNVYLHLKKYADLVEIGKLICERYERNKKVCSITLRNMTNACIRLDDLENARIYKDRLITLDPESALAHWMCSKYEDAVENYPAVVEELEKCIHLEQSDVDYYFSMAGYICDNLFVRDAQTQQIRKIKDNQADQFAVPFILTALSINRNCIQRVVDFLRRNKFSMYIEPVIDAFQKGATDYRRLFQELDFGAVRYCYQNVE